MTKDDLMPRIENSDRGITINKSLAWTILTTMVAGGIWVGVQVTSANTGVANLEQRQLEDRRDIRANSQQINGLQSNFARFDQRLNNIEEYSQRTEASVREILRYLRENPEAR